MIPAANVETMLQWTLPPWAMVLVAVQLGTPRLIDNIILE